MKPSNSLNVLPWFSSVNYQNHRKNYGTYGIYPLLAISNVLPPFQIAVSDEIGDLSRFDLHLVDLNGQSQNISAWARTNFRLVVKSSYALIINDGIVAIAGDLKEGRYYLDAVVNLDDQDPKHYYSEVFTFMTTSEGLLKIEYWDTTPFDHKYGEIEYDADATYKNYVYLQTEIGKPDYIFEEEATKRDGYTFIEKQISEKQYKFDFLAPEYLCDALRIVRMHDHIRITNVNGISYDAETILITPKWQLDGDIAVVEVEFECDTVIKKIGKKFTSLSGDYNGDYNTDYNI